MQISAEHTKLMANSANGIQRAIKRKGQNLGPVTRFKNLGTVFSDDGSKPEILSRITQATAAVTELKSQQHISWIKGEAVQRSLVISIFLYACESWTLPAEIENRTQAFEMRCYQSLLNILYKDNIAKGNEEVHRKIQAAIGKYDELWALVKIVWPCLKVFWFS